MSHIYITYFNFICNSNQDYEDFLFKKSYIEHRFVMMLESNHYLPLPTKKYIDTEMFIEFTKEHPLATIIIAKYTPYTTFKVFNKGNEYFFGSEQKLLEEFTTYLTIGGYRLPCENKNICIEKLEKLYDFDIEMST